MKETILPVSRIKTIMKSAADVDTVGVESVQILTRAAELFIKTLAKEAYKSNKQSESLDYKSVANVVHDDDRYEFLREMVPQKITVRKFRELMAKKQGSEKSSGKHNNSDSESSSGESSDDENSSDSSSSKSGDSE